MGTRRDLPKSSKSNAPKVPITRPAGMQAMGMALYQQIRQAMAELKPEPA